MHADYLVVGAGAVGLAFADTIATESDATVVIVDRAEAPPGGHWTTAYPPFVRLHQPAAYYGGVNSRVSARASSRTAATTPGCTSSPASTKSVRTTTL